MGSGFETCALTSASVESGFKVTLKAISTGEAWVKCKAYNVRRHFDLCESLVFKLLLSGSPSEVDGDIQSKRIFEKAPRSL